MAKSTKSKQLPMPKKTKLKLGVFSITSCAGCQLSLLFMEDVLLNILSSLEVVNFPLVKEYSKPKTKYDVAFIEGCAVRDEEIEIIKDIRKNSKIVVAMGACACTGGVPSIAELIDEKKVKEQVYGSEGMKYFSKVNVDSIDQHIDVDYYLRGCPVDQKELLELIQSLTIGKIPKEYDSPVCVECQKREIPCFLKRGKLCIGPVTYGGCDALCPGENIPCYGCRGPHNDANVNALLKIFEKMNYTKDDIRRMFIKFAGTSKKFAYIADEYSKDYNSRFNSNKDEKEQMEK